MWFKNIKFWKFSWGACHQTPLEGHAVRFACQCALHTYSECSFSTWSFAWAVTESFHQPCQKALNENFNNILETVMMHKDTFGFSPILSMHWFLVKINFWWECESGLTGSHFVWLIQVRPGVWPRLNHMLSELTKLMKWTWLNTL